MLYLSSKLMMQHYGSSRRLVQACILMFYEETFQTKKVAPVNNNNVFSFLFFINY